MERRFKNPLLLIIDDEEMICEVLTEIIQGLTKRVDIITATTAQEAVRLIPKADMIISDIMMPNQAMLDKALEAVMADKPVARMSGVTQDKTNFMIAKPFDVKQIAETLQFLYVFLREQQKEQKDSSNSSKRMSA